eukprot:TRINITY_DN1865_c0_g1_i1.p1 TRINITY_DN1865_c0_g1~~TRINITY_DN1865_c0_g1_i1.p1  ORF type:complete len:731 (-),score=190.01 TRINITY_DN1865_c0_g1_i1:107-2299(-)
MPNVNAGQALQEAKCIHQSVETWKVQLSKHTGSVEQLKSSALTEIDICKQSYKDLQDFFAAKKPKDQFKFKSELQFHLKKELELHRLLGDLLLPISAANDRSTKLAALVSDLSEAFAISQDWWYTLERADAAIAKWQAQHSALSLYLDADRGQSAPELEHVRKLVTQRNTSMHEVETLAEDVMKAVTAARQVCALWRGKLNGVAAMYSAGETDTALLAAIVTLQPVLADHASAREEAYVQLFSLGSPIQSRHPAEKYLTTAQFTALQKSLTDATAAAQHARGEVLRQMVTLCKRIDAACEVQNKVQEVLDIQGVSMSIQEILTERRALLRGVPQLAKEAATVEQSYTEFLFRMDDASRAKLAELQAKRLKISEQRQKSVDRITALFKTLNSESARFPELSLLWRDGVTEGVLLDSVLGDLLQQTRQHVMQEVRTYEITYLDDLKLLKDSQQLLHNSLQTSYRGFAYISSAQDIDMMFQGLDGLLAMQQSIVDKLTLSLPGDHDVQLSALAETLIEYAPVMRVQYAAYCETLVVKQQHIERCSTNYRWFPGWLKDEFAPRARSLALSTVISTPFQHILKYELFTQRLVHSTPRTHPMYTKLTEADAMMQSVARYINEKQRDKEGRDRLVELRSRVAGLPSDFIQPHRWIAAEDVEKKIVLLSDGVLVLQQSDHGAKLKELVTDWNNISVKRTGTSEIAVTLHTRTGRQEFAVRVGSAIALERWLLQVPRAA